MTPQTLAALAVTEYNDLKNAYEHLETCTTSTTHDSVEAEKHREAKIAEGIRMLQDALEAYLRRPQPHQLPSRPPIQWSSEEQDYLRELSKQIRILRLNPDASTHPILELLGSVREHIKVESDLSVWETPSIWRPKPKDPGQSPHFRELGE